MTVSKKLMSLVVALMLVGCGSTSNSSSNNAAVPVANNVNPMESAQTAYQVNKVIEKIIEQQDHKAALGLLDVSLAEQHRVLAMHQNSRKIFVEPNSMANINQQLALNMVALKAFGDVEYRYSDNYKDCCWVSHYHIMGDDKMLDVDLYIDKTSKTIFDIKQPLFQYSSVEMVTKVLDRLFELYDIEDRGSAFVYNQFFDHINAYRQGNQTHVKMIDAFETLPNSLKSNVMVAELLVKAMVLGEANVDNRHEIYKTVAQYHPDQAWLETYYFETKNIEKAISVLSNSNETVKKTYVIQGELMALYAHNGQTENALKHAMNLLYSDPNNLMSYV
ncbi:MAG: hypothetical protein MJK04_35580, partial [Psychrosphaera sp.]|nr:hypothetical protein [Psychrosphaera sp.]